MVKNFSFWIAAIICIVLDQASKYIVVRSLHLHESVPILQGFFHLTYVTNTGAAFSLFRNSGDWLKWVSLIVSAGLAVLGWFGTGLDRWEKVGYGCILGGAAGNGLDRFINGYVVDFLDFNFRLFHFPVFNIADMSINIGLVCIVIALLRSAKPNPNR